MVRPYRLVPWLLSVLFLFQAGCSKAPNPWPTKPGKRVLASFPPVYCFAQSVAGPDANVLCMLASSSPHDYEIVYQDILKVQKADLFLCNGLDLDEDFAGKMIHSAGRKDTMLVKVAEALPHEKLFHIEEEEEEEPKKKEDKHDKHDHAHKHGGKEEKHHHHKHGEHDPHVWLSPPLAMLMVDRIAEALAKEDPTQQQTFQANAAAYKAKLKELHDYGLAAFKDKKNRKLVSQHDSLRYFAQAFGLEIVGNLRLQSGLESDIGKKNELMKLCKDKQVAVITLEPHYDAKEIKTFHKDLKDRGVDTALAVVDPLETAALAAGSLNPDPEHYLKVMKQNIDNLAKALP